MKLLILYLLLLKATMSSFSGISSLPVLREDLVVRHEMLTDRELNVAVTAGRSGPGPNGLYVVSVAYLIAGIPGACVGWLAMVTPVLLVFPMVGFFGARAQHPRLESAIRAASAASAGLMIAATLPLARGALTDGFLTTIAAASFAVFSFTAIDSVWVVLACALIGLASGVIATGTLAGK